MAENSETRGSFADRVIANDDQLVAMAQLAGLVNEVQLVEAEGLCERLKNEGVAMTLSEALVKKGFLQTEQLAQLEQKRRTEQFAESIPGYRIQAKLGAGAMGSVFKAYQKSMERFVAIKILNPNLAKKPGFAERFLREAHASAKVSHPHIIAGLDVGESKGLNYFVMEFVEGDPLSMRLARSERLGIEEGLALAQQLASALLAIEQAGMIHRDLKPANILVTTKGQAKICDLGLSKLTNEDSSLTQEGHALGTPFYIAPEQVRGDKSIDARADQYALGASLYHLYTGQPLFIRDTGAATMAAHVSELATHPQSLRPELPNGIVAILRKTLAKSPENRYASAADLLRDLEEFKQGRPVSAFLSKAPSSIPSGFVESGVSPDLSLELPPEYSGSNGKAPDPVPATRGGTSRNVPIQPGLAATKRPLRRGRMDQRQSASSASLTTKLIAGGILISIVGAALYLVSKASKEMDEANQSLNRPTKAQDEQTSTDSLPAETPRPEVLTKPQKSSPPINSAKTKIVVMTSKPPVGIDSSERKQVPEQAEPEITEKPVEPALGAGEQSSANAETQVPPVDPPPTESANPQNQGPAVTENTPIMNAPKGPWEYQFSDTSELEDWIQTDPQWAVANSALISDSKGVVQRLVWKKGLAGDVTITLTGYTRNSIGVAFLDPKDPKNIDRIILGGLTGTHVGVVGPDKATPQWTDFHVADGRRHEIVIRRLGDKISVQIDGKSLIADAACALKGTPSFNVELCYWEAGGAIECVKIDGMSAP